MKTLAVYSNKGGVGKTATSVNLSHLAARTGLSTLICDLDPQGSTSYYFRVKSKLKQEARGFDTGEQKAIDRSIKSTDFENLDLLPADFSHRNLDIVFNQFKHPEQRLDKIITPLKKEYALVVLDCPPSINMLAENIFHAADFILVPLIPTPLSERTHKQLLKFFQKKGYETEKLYSFISMEDRRKRVHQQYSESLRKEFERVLFSVIPYSADIEKMGIERAPVSSFASKSKAAESYKRLWAEVYEKLFRNENLINP